MIGVNVSVGDPLSRVIRAADFDPALEAAIGSLAVPIGLAIDDMSMRGVNLLPKGAATRSQALDAGRDRRSRRRGSPARRSRLPVRRSARQGCRSAGPARRRAKAEIAALPQPTTPMIDAGVVGDEAVRATAVASVLGGRLAWDAVFRDMSQVLPANVWLRRSRSPHRRRGNLADGRPPARPRRPGVQPVPTAVSIDGYTYTQPDVARLLARLATLPSLKRVTLTSSQSQAARNQEGRALRHRCRPEPDWRCVMSALLRSPKGKIGAIAAGGLIVLLALWFLVVSPQRAKATELSADLAATQAQLVERKLRSGRPSADVTVQAERSLPPDEGAAGRHEHVGHPARPQPDRGAEQADVHLDHAGRRRSPEPDTCSSRSMSSCRAASATSRASSVTSARSSRSAASGSMPAAVSTRCRASTSPPPIARPSSRSSRRR